MYRVGLIREFIARHFLFGGDWGPENSPHAHPYRLEVRFEGDRLDEHGFLLDIAHLEPLLDGLVNHYRDALLNDLPEFAGHNPSLERFARVIADRLGEELAGSGLRSLTVRLWENERAWAELREEMA